MRYRLESLLNKTWYGGREPGILLRGLETVYHGLQAAAWRRELAARPPDLEFAPVIVVGNVTAGGTGKTPLVIHLCELLLDAGLSPGVVSRGYGRRGREMLQVAEGHSARVVGDEPLLIQRRCGVPVMVGPDRVQATRALLDAGVDLVISDDGLQRMRLPRRLEICVVDGQRGLGNKRMLPAGPLREPASRLDSVDLLVYNGPPGSGRAPGDGAVMHLRPGNPTSLDGTVQRTVGQLAQESRQVPVSAVAGIGNPGRFFSMLEELGINVVRHGFPDHHQYSVNDFKDLAGTPILMTEKDAVRCAGLGLPDAWYLPVTVELPSAWSEDFVARAVAMAARHGGCS